MRKVTLWSAATSVDFRVSFGVDRRRSWADASEGARADRASRTRLYRSGIEIMKDSFRGDPTREGGESRLERAFDRTHGVKTRGRGLRRGMLGEILPGLLREALRRST